MLDYQKRVVEEKKELDKKIKKLYVYLRDYGYNKHDTDHVLLRAQHMVMKNYSDLLKLRIKTWQRV